MPPGNRGDIGKDQDGKSDGSWWGTNSTPNEYGGEHITHYTNSGRTSFDTDQDGDYVSGSGHDVNQNGRVNNRWDDD